MLRAKIENKLHEMGVRYNYGVDLYGARSLESVYDKSKIDGYLEALVDSMTLDGYHIDMASNGMIDDFIVWYSDDGDMVEIATHMA